jgi:hypothetical protein
LQDKKEDKGGPQGYLSFLTVIKFSCLETIPADIAETNTADSSSNKCDPDFEAMNEFEAMNSKYCMSVQSRVVQKVEASKEVRSVLPDGVG